MIIKHKEPQKDEITSVTSVIYVTFILFIGILGVTDYVTDVTDKRPKVDFTCIFRIFFLCQNLDFCRFITNFVV